PAVHSNDLACRRWAGGSSDRRNTPAKRFQTPKSKLQGSTRLQFSISWSWSFRDGHGHVLLRRVYEHIHLLTDVNGKLSPLKTIDDLEHPCVHPLGAVPRERFLRHNVRLEPDEF